MRSKIVLAAVLALSSLIALPAFAHGKGEHGNAKFPMPAAEFKAKVDARTAKARERMESRAAKLPADQAKELRAKFAVASAKIQEEVAKATADGTVTKEEAKQVREVAKAARPHGKHAKRGHGKHAKKK
jgi:hypothetical protein